MMPFKNNTKLHFLYQENMRFFMLFSLFLLILQSIQTAGIDLSFDRTAIAKHEIWRLISGGLVHANFAHLLLNCLGLFCLLSLYDRPIPVYSWGLVSLLLVFCVNVGLYFILPSTEHYVGFSGALHGLFVWYSIIEWRANRSWFPISVLVILASKLCFDSFVTDSFSHQIIGMRVHWQSHWLGAISGALLSQFYKKNT
jgi:rhomboid family GlyGly-CTERM serine protease